MTLAEFHAAIGQALNWLESQGCEVQPEDEAALLSLGPGKYQFGSYEFAGCVCPVIAAGLISEAEEDHPYAHRIALAIDREIPRTVHGLGSLAPVEVTA